MQHNPFLHSSPTVETSKTWQDDEMNVWTWWKKSAAQRIWQESGNYWKSIQCLWELNITEVIPWDRKSNRKTRYGSLPAHWKKWIIVDYNSYTKHSYVTPCFGTYAFCDSPFTCCNFGRLRKDIVNLNTLLLEICHLMIYKMPWSQNRKLRWPITKLVSTTHRDTVKYIATLFEVFQYFKHWICRFVRNKSFRNEECFL